MVLVHVLWQVVEIEENKIQGKQTGEAEAGSQLYVLFVYDSETITNSTRSFPFRSGDF